MMLGEAHSEKSDVYAFGLVLWELMTWQQPWVDRSEAEVRAESCRKLPYLLHTFIYTPAMKETDSDDIAQESGDCQ